MLGLVGLGVATYLSMFQYGIVDTVWEPFFGDGSRTILTSRVSDVLPIKDAALGAIGYLLDVVSGVAYGQARWRTHPGSSSSSASPSGRSVAAASSW